MTHRLLYFFSNPTDDEGGLMSEDGFLLETEGSEVMDAD